MPRGRHHGRLLALGALSLLLLAPAPHNAPALSLLLLAPAPHNAPALSLLALSELAEAPVAAAAADDASLAPHVPGVVLVKYRPGATPGEKQQVRDSVSAVGARVLSAPGNVERLQLAGDGTAVWAMGRLKAGRTIEAIEPDYLVFPADVSNDPYYVGGSLWGMLGDSTSPANAFGTQASEAWAAGYVGSRQVYVAMLDVGLQVDHPDLAANIWTNPYDPADGIDNDGNGYVDDVHGWDFANGDASVYDGLHDDHGTAIAGTLAAEGGNGLGIAGVNWRLSVIATKIADGTQGSVSGIIAALDYVVDLKHRHGLHIPVINSSWYTYGSSQLLLDAINRAADAEMLVVAPSGNGIAGIGQNNDVVPLYPASYQCVTRFDTGQQRGHDCMVAVAGINSLGGRVTSSNYGPQSVDLGAPGSVIVSTWPPSAYTLTTGTSIAVPHVTGAIALCSSINPARTAKELLAITLGTVAPTASLQGITKTGGRVDIGSMVPYCETPIGGAHLTLTGDPAELSWIPGKLQDSYKVLRIRDGVLLAPVDVAGSASSYTDEEVTGPHVRCYQVLPLAAGAVLGQSDLACVVPGYAFGAVPPRDLGLSVRGVDRAQLTWRPPVGGADSYTLLVIPLNGGSLTTTPLGAGFTAAQVTMPESGACMHLIAVRGGQGAAADVLCGVPAFGLLGSSSGAHGESSSVLLELHARLAGLSAPEATVSP